jgi:hypothetical protein
VLANLISLINNEAMEITTLRDFWKKAPREHRKLFVDKLCAGHVTRVSRTRNFSPQKTKEAERFFAELGYPITRAEISPHIYGDEAA